MPYTVTDITELIRHHLVCHHLVCHPLVCHHLVLSVPDDETADNNLRLLAGEVEEWRLPRSGGP